MRQVLLSPDGNAIAIRSDNDADGNTAWGIIHAQHGGAWAPGASVEGWSDITPDA